MVSSKVECSAAVRRNDRSIWMSKKGGLARDYFAVAKCMCCGKLNFDWMRRNKDEKEQRIQFLCGKSLS
jgi:hypothetical protein